MQQTREAITAIGEGIPTTVVVVFPMIEEALSVIEEATAVIEGATTAVVTVGDSTAVVTVVGTGAGRGWNDQRASSEVGQIPLFQLPGPQSQVLPAPKVHKGRQVEQPQVFSLALSRTLLLRVHLLLALEPLGPFPRVS